MVVIDNVAANVITWLSRTLLVDTTHLGLSLQSLHPPIQWPLPPPFIITVTVHTLP